MKKSTWKKVEKIFHDTLDVPSEERLAFLQRTCAGNDKLFFEVESLINSLEKKSNFLDESVLEIALGALHKNGQKKITGTTIGFYEVREKIGSGGMGEVYKAFDSRLNRHVALKFLSKLVEDDPTAKRYLIKEAQAAAALDHPNICAVYGFEQTNEYHFIVMQYIEGKTLSETIEKEIIGVEKFKNLARQIMIAVAVAHSHGVIHRDLKPGNIMLTTEEQIKILDFGLAKVLHQKHNSNAAIDSRSNFSKKGLIIGTVSYMSPEQLRGEKAGHQSDIFSVGIILYELLAKTNPFTRKSQAETIAAVLSDEPLALEKIRRDIPANLIEMVEKCLQKEPENRFRSMAEILVELDKTESKSYRRITFNRRKFFIKAAFAIILLASFSLMYLYTKNSKRSIAILPISFNNQQSDNEYLADRLTQNIIDKLSNLSDLNVRHASLVEKYKKVDPRDAGKLLNVDAVFVGSIYDNAEGLILDTKIIRISDGVIIYSDKKKFDKSKLVELTENITLRIRDEIQTKLMDEDRARLVKKDTQSETAEDLYFQGRFYLKKRNEESDAVKKAIKFFTEAKDLDLNYARPWAGLADAYLFQSTPGVEESLTPKEAFELAKKMANRALALDYDLCEAHNSLGWINYRYEWNWGEAERYFRTAIDCDSSFLSARFGLINVLKIGKRYDEALLEAEKIKDLDPASIEPDIQIALIYFRKGDYEQMDEISSELFEKYPDNKSVKCLRAYQFLKLGKFNEALEILEPMYASNIEGDKILVAAPLGFAYAKMQRRNEALKIMDDLGKFKKVYVPAQESALIYVGLGDYDKAFERLNQSCKERFPALPGWINEPIVDEVRSDPRFSVIRDCAKL